MSIFTDRNREVIYHILNLLPTIDSALKHMQIQLEELRLEESIVLMKDTTEAVVSIANGLLPLINGSEKSFLELTAAFCEGIAMVIDAYEQNDLAALKIVLTHRLTSAFTSWQQELVQILRLSILS